MGIKMKLELVENKKTKRQQAEEVIAFLNEKTGRRYKPTKVNLDFILARFKEGYTIEEVRAVVALMCREWLEDDKMNRYLRPSTLFNCEKFNQYYGLLEVE